MTGGLISLAGTRPISLGPRLDGGGEGDIHPVEGMPGFLAKVYKTPLNPSKASKILAMTAMAHPCENPGIRLAWPIDALITNQGEVKGIVMRQMIGRRIVELFSPVGRETGFPGVGSRSHYLIAHLLCSGIAALHALGVVLGDISESNFLVSVSDGGKSLCICFLDCDSFQYTIAGRCHPCEVGREEFLPPEVQGTVIRKMEPSQDAFSLAVLLYLLFNEGFHPFSGVWSDHAASEIGFCIRQGAFSQNSNPWIRPSPLSPPFSALPEPLVREFRRAFGEGWSQPALRPTPVDWILALDQAIAGLVVCGNNPLHHFSRNNKTCPYCDRRTRLGFDPFPAAGTTKPPRSGKAACPGETLWEPRALRGLFRKKKRKP